MQSAPLPPDEPARLAALQRCAVLDTPPDALFDDLTEIASRLCETPIALVSLIDADRQWFKSRVGLEATETPRCVAFCSHAILEPDQVFVVPDARLDERFADNPLVENAPNVTFYAGVPLVESDGHALGTLCVIDHEARTLTEQQIDSLRALGRQVVMLLEARRRCRELERARAAAERALESRTRFLANMSHELRTPLGAILGFADLLSEVASLPPVARDYAETIVRNGQHLGSLVGDVLDLSKIEADGISLHESAVDLRAIVGEVVGLQRVTAEAKRLDFMGWCEEDVPTLFQCDATRLRQILLNLTGNAIKFTPSGSVRIRIHSAFDPNGDEVIAFEVHDSGIGIPADRLEAIFEPFGQADESTARYFGGTGLGLTISRRLAEAMGGRISAYSSPEAGSVFTLRLPNQLPSDASLSSTAVETRTEPISLAGVRVLVVDDMPDNRLLVTRMLELVGADVLSVSGARLGLAALEAEAADVHVVLMDLTMPDLDGFEALAMLRERGDHRPVAALTAAVMMEDRASCAAAGFDGYLTKPIERRALESLVARLARSAEHRAA